MITSPITRLSRSGSHHGRIHLGNLEDSDCWPVPDSIAQGCNLTDGEYAALEMVCWNRVLEMNQMLQSGLPSTNGVPDGIDCQRTTWCAVDSSLSSNSI